MTCLLLALGALLLWAGYWIGWYAHEDADMLAGLRKRARGLTSPYKQA